MNTSSKPFRAFLTGLGAVLAWAWVSTALAVPPLKGKFGPFDVVGLLVADCGDFNALLDFTLQGNFVVHFDKDGNEVGFNQHTSFPDDIYYNSENDAIFFTGNAVINDRFDSLTEVNAGSGLLFKLTIPGHGVVFHEVGRTIIDFSGEEPEILFQAGPADFDDANVAALCAALTPE